MEDSWATVVKKKAARKPKNIPIKKVILNSQGPGCTGIFFPSEQNKLDAVSTLRTTILLYQVLNHPKNKSKVKDLESPKS